MDLVVAVSWNKPVLDGLSQQAKNSFLKKFMHSGGVLSLVNGALQLAYYAIFMILV